MTTQCHRPLQSVGTALDDRTVNRVVSRLFRKLAPVMRRSVMVAGSNEAMLTVAEVCDYIKMSRHQFYKLRRGELGPDDEPLPPFPNARHHGGHMVWRRRDVDAWLSSLPEIDGMDPRSTI